MLRACVDHQCSKVVLTRIAEIACLSTSLRLESACQETLFEESILVATSTKNGPMQSMKALKVTRVVEDRDSNNLILTFDGAGLTLFCSYKLSPPELTVDNLVSARIVEVDEFDNEF